MGKTSLVWMRRELRLDDQACLATALKSSGNIQPIFIFDSEILARFSNKKDRRLSFIAQRLCVLDEQLRKRGGGLLVLHGKPQELMPKLASALSAAQVVAAEDFEPATRKRDAAVKDALPDACRFVQPIDHVIHAPYHVLKDDGTPYKVYTPFSKRWRQVVNGASYGECAVEDKGRYADYEEVRKACNGAHISTLNPADGAQKMLSAIGYELVDLGEWKVDKTHVQQRFERFVEERMTGYKDHRDMLAEEGTSKLSPYLRHGLVSVRACARAASQCDSKGAYTWLNELIWREFYIMILYHFPEVVDQEFQEQYRGIPWSAKSEHIEAWKQGKTGYPVIDAAMRQLNETGWMHNRARMIVASFASKDLDMDWRVGEEYFAQHLMDYELASNSGGWQWASSVGTDAQPYFRVFNPWLQSKKFDTEGAYIRRYVPELREVEDKYIHEPHKADLLKPANYPDPIVDHYAVRDGAIAKFKEYKDQ